jgi:drug/metabolite transporter (DMT)-like permease
VARLETVTVAHRDRTADLMLVGTILIWSLNFTVTRYVLEHGFQPLAYSTVRYGIAATLFAAFTYGYEGSLRIRRRDIVLVVVAAGLGIWLNQLSYVYAIKFTNASTTALILGITPIFAALIAFAIGLERVSSRFWLATAVSFAGVSLVAIGSGEIRGDFKGDLLGVATAATWAAYSVAIAPLMRRYSPYRISAVVLVIGWVAVAATAIPQLARQEWNLGWEVWALLVFAVLGPLVLTNILWFKAVDRVGPSHATLFANAQPFVAVIFAVLLLGETLSWMQIVGGVAIGVGIWLARRRRVRLVPGGE